MTKKWIFGSGYDLTLKATAYREKKKTYFKLATHRYVFCSQVDWTIRCSKCQGHHCTGNNQVPSIKTSSSVVEVVKLMPWRQAKSPLKIPYWSGGKMSSSYIFYNWHPPDQEGNFKGEVACLQGINLTTSNTEDDVFMDGTWLLPVQWCPWHLVNTWNTLMSIQGCYLNCSAQWGKLGGQGDI